MKKSIIVTNLRVERNEWRQLKAVAAERGLSANEYINLLLRNVVSRPICVKKTKLTIWDLPKLAKRGKPMGELSEDDKLIYGK